MNMRKSGQVFEASRQMVPAVMASCVAAAAIVLSGCGGHGDGAPVVSPAGPVTSAQVPCETLTNTAIPDGIVQSAQSIAAGSFTPPGQASAITGLPAFCRVTVLMQPTPDSDINVEVWLPQTAWNRRFLATGNGGGAGSIAYVTGIAQGLQRGFASANTDLGTSPNINNMIGHPERWNDFGYRANHEMTIAGKALVNAFYKTGPQTSYFSGCSTGGQQALSIAQRYPTDYNGIIAGAPAFNRTHLNAMFSWNLKALNATGAQMTQGKLNMVTANVVASCAGKDGGAPTDGFLTDPRQCNFNPDTLPKCSSSNDDTCLTPAQLTALEATYAGPTNPRTGERIFSGMPFGTENLPLGLVNQQDASAWPSQQLYDLLWTFGAGYDYLSFDFDHNIDTVDALLAPPLNANSADLNDFKSNGGKLIMYNGSSDPGVPLPSEIEYYERVVQDQGADLNATQNFFRYYIVPGMGHCASIGGGAGVGEFGQSYATYLPPDKAHDVLLQLVDWVENQTPPIQLIASKYSTGANPQPVMQRPLCAYPQLPVYQAGDPTAASSFICKDGPRGGVPTPAPRYLN
ncbi:tannase/feruloyl esterase family alpha/beta hydrolase [Caballeronia mineralivorans]|uniref:tannase/feruloyl esterase family alpha/beta hydrolase n=1 Tax=Caballeronia mineralivorans TaxID=2010198 RepID=UPI00069FFAEB|nr:tannase/feruloyl esterase family alpha/beta hydrolase [Caballeronia mineralivorans]